MNRAFPTGPEPNFMRSFVAIAAALTAILAASFIDVLATLFAMIFENNAEPLPPTLAKNAEPLALFNKLGKISVNISSGIIVKKT